MRHFFVLISTILGSFFALANAQNIEIAQSPATRSGWQQCRTLTDAAARLQCFDTWAQQQVKPPSPPTLSSPTCKDSRLSEISRFWELEADSDCGTFRIRGYQPISLSWIGSTSVNTQPTSPTPANNATQPVPYRNNETRVGLSVRTKMAQGLLTQAEPSRRDSLWFAYSQQANWQLFSGDLSRPFRTTDHEPELIYIYPFDAALPLGWRLRYGGLSLNHQSNGQPLPYSRSWNRTILMAGAEKGQTFVVQAKLWQRVPEAASDDDNPDIADRIGRAEFAGYWRVNPDNTLGLTLRHSLRADANGSIKLEWLRTLGTDRANDQQNGLRFHTQLFSGYGDSLIDYNRRRTTLSVGLSLVDW